VYQHFKASCHPGNGIILSVFPLDAVNIKTLQGFYIVQERIYIPSIISCRNKARAGSRKTPEFSVSGPVFMSHEKARKWRDVSVGA
jgi:hypothetical protein